MALDCVAELCEQVRRHTRADSGDPSAPWLPVLLTQPLIWSSSWHPSPPLQDVLEFYAAWCVVYAHAPTLPAHPLTAAAWVRLLGGGALDAAVHPEIATGVVDALWAATAHGSALVRRQAYASLAAFEPSTLEELCTLRPLCSYISLLRRELAHSAAGEGSTHSQRQRRRLEAARQDCEALVETALAYEHATRRRPHVATAAPPTHGLAAPAHAATESSGRRAAGTGAAAMNHRLASALPKLLLGGAAPTAAALLPRLPELPAPAIAVLLFWSPPPPSAKSPAALAAAARQAAADYLSLAVELIRQPQTSAQLTAASCSAPGGPVAAAGSWVQAWRRLLRRWAAAVCAGRGAGSSDYGFSARGEATAAGQHRVAALQIWSAISPCLVGRPVTPAAAENAAWAAAALSSAGPQPVPDVVSAAHAALSALLDDGQQATAVRQAAASALGTMAESVRTAMGQLAVQELLMRLQALVQQGPLAGGALLRGAAAIGLGLACRQLAVAAADAPSVRAMVQSAVSALFAAQQQQQGGSDPAAAEVCSGLAAVLSAAVALEVGVVQQLPPLLSSSLAQLSALQAPAATTIAALAPLLQAAAAAGFQQGSLAADQVGATLAALLVAAASSDGRARGAAAAAAAALLVAAMEEGYTPSAEEHAPGALLATLLELAGDAGKLPHAAAAKCGAAAGVAALLEGQALDPGSQEFKGAGTRPLILRPVTELMR